MLSVLNNPSVRSLALRLVVDQYHRLCDSGIVPEKRQVIIYRNADPASASFDEASTIDREVKLTWLGNDLDCADLFVEKVGRLRCASKSV